MNEIQVTSPMLLAHSEEGWGNNNKTNKRGLENITFQRTKSESIENDFHFSSTLLYSIKLLLILRAGFTIVGAPGNQNVEAPISNNKFML